MRHEISNFFLGCTFLTFYLTQVVTWFLFKQLMMVVFNYSAQPLGLMSIGYFSFSFYYACILLDFYAGLSKMAYAGESCSHVGSYAYKGGPMYVCVVFNCFYLGTFLVCGGLQLEMMIGDRRKSC